MELIKRQSGNTAYGLTTPLITLASGAKMGKTEQGAVWLDKKMLSPYDYWQFWRNTDDRDVIKFLKMFTDLSLEKIENIKTKDINYLKILLANETTSMLHGDEAARQSEETAKNTFKNKSIDENLPSVTISKNQIEKEINILDIVILSKMLSSKGEIRRMIKNKGIKINNVTIDNEKRMISKKDFKENSMLKLSLGKKKHTVFKIN